ncbi:MAG: hypothetical protein SangKO_048210 [Sandaracinaceae bacterium]
MSEKSERMKFRAIGYWRENGSFSDLPDPRESIDPDWDPAERFDVGRYLRRGQVIAVSRGKAVCSLCGEILDARTLADSDYAWPGGTAHYVEEHCVRLPEEFVSHVQARVAATADLTACIDFAWWRECEPLGTSHKWLHWNITIEVSTPDLAQRIEHFTSNRESGVVLVRASGTRLVLRTADARRVSSVARSLESAGVTFEVSEQWTPIPRDSANDSG